MRKREQPTLEREPIGIVISRGTSVEPPPVFWAYVYGPAPEVDPTGVEPQPA